MAKPSIPLPWKVNKREAHSVCGPLVEIADETGLRLVADCGGENRRANADYIVEACNAYPALKAENAGLRDAMHAVASHLEAAATVTDDAALRDWCREQATTLREAAQP